MNFNILSNEQYYQIEPYLPFTEMHKGFLTILKFGNLTQVPVTCGVVLYEPKIIFPICDNCLSEAKQNRSKQECSDVSNWLKRKNDNPSHEYEPPIKTKCLTEKNNEKDMDQN